MNANLSEINNVTQLINSFFLSENNSKKTEIRFINFVLEQILKLDFNICSVFSDNEEAPPLSGYFDALKRIVEEAQSTILLQNSAKTIEINILINNGCNDGSTFGEWMVSTSEENNIYNLIQGYIDSGVDLFYDAPF